MLFNSFTFFAFFAVVFFVMRREFPWRAKKSFLLVASYFFYAAWNPPFVVLLWVATVVDFYIARWIGRTASLHRKRFLIGVSLVLNLGLLAYFKYGGFFMENLSAVLHALGIPAQFVRPDIILPAGISFYTFLTLSYTLDVYWGRIKAWDSLLDYAVYVTFFPHLIAGPIIRADYFLPQCKTPRRATGPEISWGLTLFVMGLFQKVVIADNLMAPIVEDIFDKGHDLSFLGAWAGALAFTVQIFCDFAGYSTCAIGLAAMMGFSLPRNFNGPYAAVGFSDFWRRWHISLSTWLRDYLYIPLGGNRTGSLRTYANLMITMLIGGLWHGASWMFVIWGGLHGLFLAAEKWVTGCRISSAEFWRTTAGRTVIALTTSIVVCGAWVFFRASTMDRAIGILGAMIGLNGISSTYKARFLFSAGVFLALFASHCWLRERHIATVWQGSNKVFRGVILGTMMFAILLSFTGEDRAFIYFQF